MHRHFMVTVRIFAAVFLTSSVLFLILPSAQGQDQTQIDNLRKDVSYLNIRVCGVTEPTDPAAKKVYDDQMQALNDAAAALIAALDQQKGKLTGSDFDTSLRKEIIDEEEKSLKQTCPALPDYLQKLVNAAAPAAPAPTPFTKPPVDVSPSTTLHFDTLTVGTVSAPQTVTVKNQTGQTANLYVWYGTHLPDFWVSEDSCDGGAIPDQGTCTFKVTFTPAQARNTRTADEHLWILRWENWKQYETLKTKRGETLRAQKNLQAAEDAVQKASEQVTELRSKLSRKSKEANTNLQKQFCATLPDSYHAELAEAKGACNRWEEALNGNDQKAIQSAGDQVTEERKRLRLSRDQALSLDGALNDNFCHHSLANPGRDESADSEHTCDAFEKAISKNRKLQQQIRQSGGEVTEADINAAADNLREHALSVISLSGQANHWKYPLTRAVVGLDLSAVSSQTVRQAYFVDFNLLAPFKLPGTSANEDALENRLWFWLNPRITSLPKAANSSALSTIDESGTFFTNFSNQGSTADIAQGFDVNGGVEIALLKPRDGIPVWGEYVNTQARLGISAIGGAGVATPFSTSDADVTSQVNQSICDAFKTKTPATFQGIPVSDPTGLVCTFPSGSNSPQIVAPNPAFDPTNSTSPKTVNDPFISFFTPQRSRFFRRYYAGFRLKTYFFSPDVKGDCKPPRKDSCDAPYDIFPGIIDVTAGQDEAVTHGQLTRILLRVEGVYPLPFVPGLHVFGSIYTSFKKNTQSQPFNTFTVNTPTNGAANDANTFRFPLNPLDRDYFRVGIGVDLIQLLKRNKGGQPTTATAASTSQSGSGASPTGQSGGGGSSNPQ